MEIESKVAESTSEGVEGGITCDLCKKPQTSEDIFPLGTQDPATRTVAVIIACRICFVGNISLELRRAIYALWDV